jgi:hypothetical protein
LAVGDVLVDLVLGVLGAGVGVGADVVAEAEELGDVAGDDRNGEAVGESVCCWKADILDGGGQPPGLC